jgi:chromosome segregation ATPase
MIEPIMYFGIGFLFASLFGLVLIPLVHNRAVRLTMKRLEAATPLSMAEIQADKDQLRAEFAMSTRRLEMSVEQLKARTTTQLAEIGKKSDAINRLKLELGEKTATIFALEARERSLRDQIRTTEQEISVKANTLHDAERSLTDRQGDLSKLTAELGEKAVLTDSQRVEIVALRTQVDTLKNQVEKFDNELKEAEDRLTRERSDADAASRELSDERSKVENLSARVTQLERQLMVQTTEAEILGRRVQDLETRLTEQGRLIVERDYETNQLKAELDAAHKIEADLRAELATAVSRNGSTSESLRAEKTLIESQLELEREQRARAQLEIQTMKREAETTWAAERVENALLRERINDIAAEVARLTAALEGPGSRIDTILAAEAVSGLATGSGLNGRPATNGDQGEQKSSLAERIRALQSRSARVPSTS